MKIAKLLYGVGLLAATMAAGGSSPAQEIKNIVLVHGAWADGSSWSKVIPLLQDVGFNVTAVQLPLTSVADDVATVERALALEDGPVLLVGHSYGGEVITAAGNDSKVKALVYVAAYAPQQGESALSLATAYPTDAANHISVDSANFLKLTPEGIEDDFAYDLSEVEKKRLTATEGPWSFAGFSAPFDTTPAWTTKPSWFVIASGDRVISPDLERIEAQRMHAVTITLNTSHVAMLKEPIRVAAFIGLAAIHRY